MSTHTTWWPARVGHCLTWAYLLRVPLLVASVAAVVPLFYLNQMGPSDLVRGAFDASPWWFVLVTAVAGFLLGSLLTNSRLILDYGDKRYRVPELTQDAIKRSLRLLGVFYAAAVGLSLWACFKLAVERHASGWELLGYVAGLSGLACPCLTNWLANRMARQPFVRRLAEWLWRAILKVAGLLGKIWGVAWLWRWLLKLRDGLLRKGYFAPPSTRGKPRRLLRWHQRSMVFGAATWFAVTLLQFVPSRNVPAIVYVLLLLLLACWLLSTLSFLCDRYRIPITTVAVGMMFLCSFFPRSDYFFDTVPAQPLPTAADALGYAVKDAAVADRPIAIAAEGGGIHSGAWAVEVLSQLIELSHTKKAPQSVRPVRDQGLDFTRCVRAVSGVSGGSYGLMFFANAYDTSTGAIPPGSTEEMRRLVQRSSLAPTVHTLVYGDLWHDFILLSFYRNRGYSMEQAWIEGTDLTHETLAEWADDARKGTRPVVLFNSTSVERGRPVVFGTSPVSDWNFDKESASDPSRTVAVSTGARLSAAFPFVSPAARPEASPDITIVDHHVDGGYYDNFGLVSLTKWLKDGLSDLAVDQKKCDCDQLYTTHPRRLLVIQIRYHDGADGPEVAGTCVKPDPPQHSKVSRGGLFQARAPIVGLLNVRTSAQKLRNNEEFDLFSKYWLAQGVTVDNAVFEFQGSAPLSWHLTQTDKDELKCQGDEIRRQYTLYDFELRAHLKENRRHDQKYPHRDLQHQEIQDEKDGRFLDDLAQKYPLGASAWLVLKYLWEQPEAPVPVKH